MPIAGVLSVAAYPVLFLYFANAGEARFSEMIPSLLYFFVAAVIIYALFLCFSVILMGNAFAYIDPSTTTYVIQLVAGVVVAVGAVAGIYWRKAKKKVQDKLGIDENSKKEVEEDVVELSSEKAEDSEMK